MIRFIFKKDFNFDEEGKRIKSDETYPALIVDNPETNSHTWFPLRHPALRQAEGGILSKESVGKLVDYLQYELKALEND